MTRISNVVFCHSHGSDLVNLLATPILGDIAKRLFAKAVMIIPSRHLLNSLETFGLTNIEVIENFFDGEFSPSTHKRNIILWNSNIIIEKGFLEFVELAYFAKRRKQSEFVAFGKVIYKNNRQKILLEKIIEQSGNMCVLDYLGSVDQEVATQVTADAAVQLFSILIILVSVSL